MSSVQIDLLLLVTHVLGAQQPKVDTIDYVFAAQDLAGWRKDVNDGRHLTDDDLKKQSKPSQGITALLMRVKREDGEVKEIQVFYSRVRQPKIAPVREKPFTPADPDFKYLMKAIR